MAEPCVVSVEIRLNGVTRLLVDATTEDNPIGLLALLRDKLLNGDDGAEIIIPRNGEIYVAPPPNTGESR